MSLLRRLFEWLFRRKHERRDAVEMIRPEPAREMKMSRPFVSKTDRDPSRRRPTITDHRWNAESVVPQIPLHLRPKRGLANYHLLWEAEWKKLPPLDPFLLRRIGQGDLWLVCAQWNLTAVEQGALSTRLTNA